MLGGNNNNPLLPVFLDGNHIQYQTNPSNQLQLFVPAGCNEQMTAMLLPNKRGRREAEDFNRQQKLQISFNYNIQDEIDHRSTYVPNPNDVSTGLRLSYDDEERNSSVTSASGSIITTAPSIFLSLGTNIRTELDRQKEEIDQYIKIQEEHLVKSVRDMKQRHIASFISAIEKGANKKLREKDIELENMNRKNKELSERIKQVSMEGQNWHYRAKYSESVVNVLKRNLQQALSMGVEQAKEGFGDSEVDDDAASYINRNNYLNCRGLKGHVGCRMCKWKEACVLLMPCRHLCLCKECDVLANVCPVCQMIKTNSVQVYLS